MHFKKGILFLLLFVTTALTAQDENIAVPFTLADRDRIMRTEQRLDALEKSIDQRFDAQQKSMDERFDAQNDKLNDIQTMLYFLLGSMIALIGFVLWDRRTAIAPVQREQKRLIRALEKYSDTEPKLAQILQETGIL